MDRLFSTLRKSSGFLSTCLERTSSRCRTDDSTKTKGISFPWHLVLLAPFLYRLLALEWRNKSTISQLARILTITAPEMTNLKSKYLKRPKSGRLQLAWSARYVCIQPQQKLLQTVPQVKVNAEEFKESSDLINPRHVFFSKLIRISGFCKISLVDRMGS